MISATQQALTFDYPASRRNDPPSSRRAASDLQRTGTMRGQRLLAFELVKQSPGRTSKELGELGTLDRYQLARRLPELESSLLVVGTRRGKEDTRWWPR